jgi:hypothetical protein
MLTMQQFYFEYTPGILEMWEETLKWLKRHL